MSQSGDPRRPPVRRNSSLMLLYLQSIRSGAKTVEGRLRSGNWADVQPGDVFHFTANEDAREALVCRATFVHTYGSFRGMLQGEGLSACLPGVGDLEAGVELYRSFPGYREREELDGVVAVGVEVVREE